MNRYNLTPSLLVTETIHVPEVYVYCGLIEGDTDTEEMEIVQETKEITLQENQIFGIEFGLMTASRKEQTEPIELTYEICLPPDKESGRQYLSFHGIFEYSINTYQFLWQKIDTDAELVAGQWTFRVLCGNRKLVEEIFQVIANSDE